MPNTLTEKEYRTFEGEIKVLQRNNEFLYDVELWLLNDLVNRNNWQYINLERHMKKFAGTPILVAYIHAGKVIGDGHNFRTEKDPKTGRESASFTDATAERIVGALSEDEKDIRLVERDGVKWIVAKGFLWRWYAKELVDKIERDSLQGRDMSISIETLVTKYHMDGAVEVEEEYEILGTTILGDHVAPAVVDARIVALQDMDSEFKELKVRAASYVGSKEPPKPQKNKKKGMNNLTVFSKKQLEALQPSFNGYHVLAAMQNENGIHVCLMSEDGATATYTMGSIHEAVVPEKIAKTNAQVTFAFGEDCNVSVDSCALTESIVSRLNEANIELGEKKTALEKAESDIKAMRDAEEKRRVNAAKAKATAVLATFNENREEKVADSVLESINANADAGLYTNCVNADGLWCGEEQVETAVLAICAQKVMELDQKTAQARKNTRVWDKPGTTEPQDDGSLQSLLARKAVQ